MTDNLPVRIVGPYVPPTDVEEWGRGLSPWHEDAFPSEYKADAPEHGERRAGWYRIDWCGNVVGWVPDGTEIEEAACDTPDSPSH